MTPLIKKASPLPQFLWLKSNFQALGNLFLFGFVETNDMFLKIKKKLN